MLFSGFYQVEQVEAKLPSEGKNDEQSGEGNQHDSIVGNCEAGPSNAKAEVPVSIATNSVAKKGGQKRWPKEVVIQVPSSSSMRSAEVVGETVAEKRQKSMIECFGTPQQIRSAANIFPDPPKRNRSKPVKPIHKMKK